MAAYGASGFPLSGGTPFDPNWSPNYFYLDRGSTDLEAGRFTGDQVVSRGVFGLKGDFSAFGQSYHWDVGGQLRLLPQYLARSGRGLPEPGKRDQSRARCQWPDRLSAGRGQFTDRDGILDLRAARHLRQGDPSTAARTYVTHIATAESSNTQRDFTADLSGPIVKLPADYWKFALGFENRRESASFEPDAFYTSNPPAGDLSASPIEGSYHTNEIYAETLIPVFEPSQHIPGAEPGRAGRRHPPRRQLDRRNFQHLGRGPALGADARHPVPRQQDGLDPRPGHHRALPAGLDDRTSSPRPIRATRTSSPRGPIRPPAPRTARPPGSTRRPSPRMRSTRRCRA